MGHLSVAVLRNVIWPERGNAQAGESEAALSLLASPRFIIRARRVVHI
jgi:hypothetical protein